jgi:hypothetical protein
VTPLAAAHPAQVEVEIQPAGANQTVTEGETNCSRPGARLRFGERASQPAHEGVNTAQIPADATRSDDGQWWWDGSQWQPVPQQEFAAPDTPTNAVSDSETYVGYLEYYFDQGMTAEQAEIQLQVDFQNDLRLVLTQVALAFLAA